MEVSCSFTGLFKTCWYHFHSESVPTTPEYKIQDLFMEALLINQVYEVVLPVVWAENDPQKRITWLQEKAEKGHWIFFLQLAVELYEQNPTKEVLRKNVAPLFDIVKCLSEQDIACFSGEEEKQALTLGMKNLQGIFRSAINKRVKAQFEGMGVKTVIKEGQAEYEFYRKKQLQKVFFESLYPTLSVNWMKDKGNGLPSRSRSLEPFLWPVQRSGVLEAWQKKYSLEGTRSLALDESPRATEESEDALNYITLRQRISERPRVSESS